MSHTMTAEKLFRDLGHMPFEERQKFFMILSANAFPDDDLSHAALFGHLAGEEFTSEEAAEYLEVSMSTFRRYVSTGKLKRNTIVGRNQMFAVPDLKAFKRSGKWWADRPLTHQPIFATVDAHDLKLLPRLDAVPLPDLGGQDDLALCGSGCDAVARIDNV